MVVWSRYSSQDMADPKGSWDVYQWRSGATSVVADTPANETSPSVSGDGRVIAWGNDNSGSKWAFDIFKWEDGKTEAVTYGGGNDQYPLVNGDGSRIFFRRTQR